MKAKILIQSNNVNTYVNVMAALCEKFPVTQIMLSFIDKEPNKEFIDEIQNKLLELSTQSDYDLIYSKASRVRLEEETATKNYKAIVKGWDIIDVTGVSKVIAINISAASIANKKVHVCHLAWNKLFKEDEEWILKENNHQYEDLMSMGALSNLYQEYFQKKHVIIIFGLLFLIVFSAAIIKVIWPSFVVPEDIVNLFSLLIGASGLYLAILSLKNKNI